MLVHTHTHTHTAMDPCSVCQPAWVKLRYRLTFSQECWELSEVTCNRIRCQISGFISAWLLNAPADVSCLNLRALLEVDAPACDPREHSEQSI